MLEGIFELTTTCRHLSSPVSCGEQSNPDLANTLSHSISPSGRIAIIAIGNPLLEEDSAAIALIQRIQNTRKDSQYCLFHFDSGFAWLKEVLLTHDSVIILDSILDSSNTHDGFATIPLTRSVLDDSGFVIRATHGLSWLDEIKMIDGFRTDALFFFGIDGRRFKEGNESERTAFIERGLQKLTEAVLENCSMSALSVRPGGSTFNA